FNNGVNYQQSASYNGITAGSYNIVISDANGCTSTTVALISNAPGPIISNTTTSNVTCFGLNNGTANITITSGTAPVTYSLNGGTSQANGVYSNLGPGTYNVLVTDANGCTTNTNFNITQPSGISATSNSTNSTCGNSDGSLTINAVGGTSPYSYSINNGNTSQGSSVFNLMPSGNYNILITDANGCTQTITATINNSAAPVIQSNNSTNITCNGQANGSISVVSTGGTGTLTYSLNGSTSQSNGIFNGLGPGTYTIIVSDNNGCTVSSQSTITQPALLTSTSTSILSTCGNNNGSITLTVQGGTSPYTYSLNNGPSQVSTSFAGLTQGTYGIIVSDANGCTTALQTAVAGAPGPFLNQGVATNITCNGLANGTIQIVSTGGTTPIQYSIDGGATFSSNPTFPNLAPGSYNLLVSDANGCTSTSSTSISQPTALSINPGTTNSTCGQSDGSISILATGGSSPYSYSINNGTTFQPVATFNSLPAGGYNVIVSDGNGCTTTSLATINNDAAPAVVSSTFTNVTCYGQGNGTILVNANGGTGSLSYSINGGTSQVNGAYSNLGPGIYIVVITDVNGCTANSQLTIIEPSALTAVNTTTPST
ncbi:MAG: beta strand repeat-containing protein, partial [Bacteroidota bacterium]